MTYAMRLNGGQLIQDGEGVRHPDGFTVNVIADGTGFGNPEPLVKTLNTLMTQGSWETLGQPGNRSPALVIEIEGDTPDGLNAGEVWLSGLMGSGALEWLPPDQTVWTVFDVVWCYIDRTIDERWDLDEAAWVRYYRVPIKALPHARSRFRTITPALPLASTPIIDELITDGSSVTGWTAEWKSDYGIDFGGSITPEVVSGAVRIEHPVNQAGGLVMRAKYAIGSAVPADTQFVQVDLRFHGPVSLRPAIATNGTTTTNLLPLQVTQVEAGDLEVTAYYRVPAGTTALTVCGYVTENDDYFVIDTAYMDVDQVRRLSRLPDSGTNRQKLAAITPGGSAPAEGSLHVSHPTGGLGKVLIYTYPLGRPSPALMQYRTSSQTAEPDATAINGQLVPLNPIVARMTVPDSMLPIRGRAALWAKVKVTTAPVRLRWTIQPKIGSGFAGPAQTGVVTVPIGDGILVPLGLPTLPGTTVGSEGSVEVSLAISGDDSGDGLAWVDEMWPFGQDEDSALTIANAGTGSAFWGGPANHLWINAPTAEKPNGEVLVGTNSTDARWPQLIQAGPEVHKFGRDGVGVLTVTCGATDASTDFAHFKRWTHHAAEES